MFTAQNFTPAFETFFAGCVKIYNDYCDQNGFCVGDHASMREKFTCTDGTRYMKVLRGGSVHCFVDKMNGDVRKPANWKAPAKHPRGNIFDTKNGLGWMGPHGPAYLR